MAKGPIVTDQVKLLIASVHKKHLKWKAPEVRNEVDIILHEKNPKLPPKWPSLSTVHKLLAILRKREKEGTVDPRDWPWSTVSMTKYPIPAEALPSVLRAWVWVRENTTRIFTIREAQWVARLYTVLEDIEALVYFSEIRSFKEWLSEQVEVPLSGSHLTDLRIFEAMTGYEEIPMGRRRKILRFSDQYWLVYQEQGEFFDSKTEEELHNIGIKGRERLIKKVRKLGSTTLTPEEAQNEGIYSPED